MTAFVLLHGAWHGGWCWEPVVTELVARGHTALAPDLPITDPVAGAAAYADVVRAVLPPGEVVVVAHSLGGLVAPLLPASRIVYVAAMLPEPGRAVDDRARAGERMTRRGIGRGQTANADGSTSFRPDAAAELVHPDSPPDRQAWAAARLRPQQWRITAEPSPLTGWPDVPARYVLCRRDAIIDTDWARAAAPARAELVELDGDHSPQLARPAQLADLLI
jgi:pimeloyl-ACP methyl ester carboxylesterase